MIKHGRGLGSCLNQRDIEARMAKAGQILNHSIENTAVQDARIIDRNRRAKSKRIEDSELVKEVMNPTYNIKKQNSSPREMTLDGIMLNEVSKQKQVKFQGD